MTRRASRLSYKTRRRLALLVLCIGLPAYVVAAVSLVGLFERPPLWVELAVYVGLGFLWILPLRPIFLGIGQPDPEAASHFPADPHPEGRRLEASRSAGPQTTVPQTIGPWSLGPGSAGPQTTVPQTIGPWSIGPGSASRSAAGVDGAGHHSASHHASGSDAHGGHDGGGHGDGGGDGDGGGGGD